MFNLKEAMALAAVALAATVAGGYVGNETTLWLGIEKNVCFYDFGYPEELQMPRDIAGCGLYSDSAIDRGFPLKFYGNSYDRVHWINNGVFLFDSNCHGFSSWCLDFPLSGVPEYSAMFAYQFDMRTNMGGRGAVWVGARNETDEMAPMVADLASARLTTVDWVPSWAVTATVVGVTQDEGLPEWNEVATFQMTLVCDANDTYAIFKYGPLKWPGPNTPSVQGCHTDAVIGFAKTPTEWWLYKPGVVSGGDSTPGDPNPNQMETETNCDTPGMLVFKVTDGIEQPVEGAQCSGSCSGFRLKDKCDRCGSFNTSTPHCERFGYCFSVGTLLSDTGCHAGCACVEAGKWKCKKMKKDKNPLKQKCQDCFADGAGAPCTDDQETGAKLIFVDSVWCGMRDCLVAAHKKLCGEKGLQCAGAAFDPKFFNHKKAHKFGVINKCDLAEANEP